MAGMKISSAAQMLLQTKMMPAEEIQPSGGAAVCFQNVMEQASVQNTADDDPWSGSDEAAESVCTEESSVEHYERYQYHDNEIKEQETEVKNMDAQDAEKLDAYADDVKEMLAEELGVTEEQIEEAMQILGMSSVDLLDTKQMTALVAQLTGCSDMGELLCSGEFLHVMQAVRQMGKELLQELGITVEELKQMAEVQNVSDQIPELTGQPDGKAELTGQPDQKAELTGQPDGKAELTGQPDGKAELTGQPDQKAELTKQGENADVQAIGHGKQAEGNMPAEHANGDMKNSGQIEISQQQMPEDADEQPELSQQEKNNFMKFSSSQQTEPNASDKVNVNEPTAFGQIQTEANYVQGTSSNVAAYTRMDVNHIIHQIVEFSKVTINEMETTMEMQLNPEQLGKIYMTVTSKDGMVSAQIMAQNEAVKEVLEAQLAELRQNMNEAGVKVEAVEVTVGSHEFERNLEQNAKQEERQAEEQEKAAKQTRKIRLDELDGLSGIMSEEETLVARMMAEQGNSVDFTA